ncbi:cyclopentanone 1,2-monooxygenase [Lentinula detonsa]|uniref:Cyclopentanone 1,2-monooxygenase n=1 Tax=Lentinula detonsa TaxID=2804962 RepID=A0AA38Q368_9AGAR|nr:cyclopentanone 1,2-monooxygenase [Lentinula detonsa]
MSSPDLILDVLCVGAGFAGIFELYRLRSLGYSTKVFEAEGDIGGVWWRNCYPGARVDSVVPVYEFSDEKVWRDWSWSEIYPGRKELRRYFQHVDEKLDVRKDIVFNRKVVSAKWNADNDRWFVKSQDGFVVSARFFLLCVGNTSKIYIPDIPGLDRFRGACHHTARWPQEGIDLHGKRVAVIGTGASGVQVIQDVGPRASSLTVYQRTPNIAFPMRQKSIDDDASRTMKHDVYSLVFRRRKQTSGGHSYASYPKNSSDATLEERFLFYEDLWSRTGGLQVFSANYQDMQWNQQAKNEFYQFWRSKVLERVQSPKFRAILAPEIPPHPVGAKRSSLEISYFDTFNLPNVDLIDLGQDPIIEITANGILTADGKEREFDVIILATGFDAMTGGINKYRRDRWHIYFRQMGERCANLLGNDDRQIPQLVFHLWTWRPDRIFEWADVHSEEEWQKEVLESMSSSLLSAPTSVFMGKNIPGKVSEPLSYVGGIPKYTELCRKKMENGFEGFSRSSIL